MYYCKSFLKHFFAKFLIINENYNLIHYEIHVTTYKEPNMLGYNFYMKSYNDYAALYYFNIRISLYTCNKLLNQSLISPFHNFYDSYLCYLLALIKVLIKSSLSINDANAQYLAEDYK